MRGLNRSLAVLTPHREFESIQYLKSDVQPNRMQYIPNLKKIRHVASIVFTRLLTFLMLFLTPPVKHLRRLDDLRVIATERACLEEPLQRGAVILLKVCPKKGLWVNTLDKFNAFPSI